MAHLHTVIVGYNGMLISGRNSCDKLIIIPIDVLIRIRVQISFSLSTSEQPEVNLVISFVCDVVTK